MLEVISFGAVWTAWCRGRHVSMQDKTLAEKIRSDPYTFKYHFGLNPEAMTECIPAQVTWMNRDPALWVYDGDPVTAEALEPKVLTDWMRFNQLLLLPALAQRRIQWGVSMNYYDYADQLQAQGRQVINYLR